MTQTGIDWRTEMQGPDGNQISVQVAELARYELAVMPTMQGDVWPRDSGYDPTKKGDWLVRVIGIGPVGNGSTTTAAKARCAAEKRALHLLRTLQPPTRHNPA